MRKILNGIKITFPNPTRNEPSFINLRKLLKQTVEDTNSLMEIEKFKSRVGKGIGWYITTETKLNGNGKS